MKVAIMTDSNSGISQTQAKKLGVTVVPMPFLIGEDECFEDINLSQDEFYEKLMTSINVSTSQPNVYAIGETWTELLKTYDEVVYIPMSSGLSGSCETAANFAKDFGGKVFVVDNKRISVTQKQAVIDAVNMAKDGKSGAEIAKYLMDTSLNASIYIMVTTLKYLKKGGRITPAAALIGSLLKIKPVLTIQGEKLDKFCQVISYEQGKKRMIDQVKKELETRFKKQVADGNFKIMMAYTKDRERCEQFKNEANEMLKHYGLLVEVVDPLSLSVACHIGDGAIAIAMCECYKK